MGWILMIVFPASTLSITVDTREQCLALAQQNLLHWQATRQPPGKLVCAKTFRI